MSNQLRAGQKITVIGMTSMASTIRTEYTVKSPTADAPPCGYGNQYCDYGSVLQRGKRKEQRLTPKPSNVLILDGWDLPVKADYEEGAFRGNALLNLIGDPDTIRGLIEQAAVPVDDEAKAICVVWKSAIVDSDERASITMPSDEFTLLYPALAENRGHAVLDRMIDELADEEAAHQAEIDACPDCNTAPTGPVPAYCHEHDGDYSDWIVRNNID